MNARTALNRLFITTIALSAIALTACAEGPAGIFASVATETPTNDTMTKAIQYASPSFVARLGTSYYAGIGSLWTKADTATVWTPASITTDIGLTSGSTAFASSGTIVGGALYVAFTDSASGTSLGVWSTTDGTTWARVDASFPTSTGYLRGLIAANDNLFAVTETVRASTTETASYSIYHFNGTAFVATGIAANTEIGLPNSAAYFSSAYWFTAGGKLVTGTGAFTDFAAVATGPEDWTSTASATTYGGICATDAGLVVSSRNGYLYYSTNGTDWIKNTTQLMNSKSKAYSLSAPTYVAYGAIEAIAVGTTSVARSSSDTPPAGGYLEFNISAGFTAAIAPDANHTLFSDAGNFDTSLAGRIVGAMPVFVTGPDTKKLFALTDGYGLWSNTYKDSAWSTWIRE